MNYQTSFNRSWYATKTVRWLRSSVRPSSGDRAASQSTASATCTSPTTSRIACVSTTPMAFTYATWEGTGTRWDTSEGQSRLRSTAKTNWSCLIGTTIVCRWENVAQALRLGQTWHGRLKIPPLQNTNGSEPLLLSLSNPSMIKHLFLPCPCLFHTSFFPPLPRSLVLYASLCLYLVCPMSPLSTIHFKWLSFSLLRCPSFSLSLHSIYLSLSLPSLPPIPLLPYLF